MFWEPFSTHQDKDIEQKLSHATLAQRAASIDGAHRVRRRVAHIEALAAKVASASLEWQPERASKTSVRSMHWSAKFLATWWHLAQ